MIRKVKNTIYRSHSKNFVHCHVGLLWAGSDNLISVSADSWTLQFCDRHCWWLCTTVSSMVKGTFCHAGQSEDVFCKDLLNMRVTTEEHMKVCYQCDLVKWYSGPGEGECPHLVSECELRGMTGIKCERDFSFLVKGKQDVTNPKEKWEEGEGMHDIIQNNPCWRFLSVQEWEKIAHVEFRGKNIQSPNLDSRRRKPVFLALWMDWRDI